MVFIKVILHFTASHLHGDHAWINPKGLVRNMSSPFLWSFVVLLTFAESDGEAGGLELQRQKRNADLQQPRMTTERGNLVFLTASAQNIEFRTGSLGKIKLNDEDLGECLHQWKCASRYNDCDGGSEARCVHGICEDLVRERAGEPKYSCICDVGWMSPPNSPACTLDRDECSLLPAPCSALVECFNTLGSFYCGACPTVQDD
ncbi:hypothetical protein MC885_017347 [Smutsia gigantea]|nr:hypothetical protein MC885_017347 [Smutsia gigantea]